MEPSYFCNEPRRGWFHKLKERHELSKMIFLHNKSIFSDRWGDKQRCLAQNNRTLQSLCDKTRNRHGVRKGAFLALRVDFSLFFALRLNQPCFLCWTLLFIWSPTTRNRIVVSKKRCANSYCSLMNGPINFCKLAFGSSQK